MIQDPGSEANIVWDQIAGGISCVQAQDNRPRISRADMLGQPSMRIRSRSSASELGKRACTTACACSCLEHGLAQNWVQCGRILLVALVSNMEKVADFHRQVVYRNVQWGEAKFGSALPQGCAVAVSRRIEDSIRTLRALVFYGPTRRLFRSASVAPLCQIQFVIVLVARGRQV